MATGMLLSYDKEHTSMQFARSHASLSLTMVVSWIADAADVARAHTATRQRGVA